MTRATDTFAARRNPVSTEEPKLGHLPPEVALRLIGSISSAALQLTALRALLRGSPLSEKAAAIVEELDVVIRDIRAVVSE